MTLKELSNALKSQRAFLLLKYNADYLELVRCMEIFFLAGCPNLCRVLDHYSNQYKHCFTENLQSLCVRYNAISSEQRIHRLKEFQADLLMQKCEFIPGILREHIEFQSHVESVYLWTDNFQSSILSREKLREPKFSKFSCAVVDKICEIFDNLVEILEKYSERYGKNVDESSSKSS